MIAEYTDNAMEDGTKQEMKSRTLFRERNLPAGTPRQRLTE